MRSLTFSETLKTFLCYSVALEYKLNDRIKCSQWQIFYIVNEGKKRTFNFTLNKIILAQIMND